MKWRARGTAVRPAQKNCAKCAHKPRSRATAVGLRRIRLLDLRLVALACGIGRPESGLARPHAPKKARFRSTKAKSSKGTVYMPRTT